MHSHFPSLEELIIWNSLEIESFLEGGLPSNLRRLRIWYCEKLVACQREWGLQRLLSLTHFTLAGNRYEEEDDDDVLESFLEEGLLPPTLASLWIGSLPNLKSINYQSFQHLTCLKLL
ncbi:putative disease resistance protein [Camellia lanceoleosa]|uniref:Disease resistance protein n=1 Tax=Camellia lanceoleosa TaxID=1840588 RepID=A0ACC0II92_9ERIC|nr:putative disease resistance protein [Camellia lanceoleosa]